MEMLRYVVLVNALLAVVSGAYYVLLRRETFFRTNRLVLWLGVVATLLLPLLELPDWRPQPMRTVMHRTAQVIVPKILPGTPKPDVTITFPDQRSYPAFQHQSAYAGWSWPMLLLLLYIGGVLVLLTRLGVQLSSLRRLIRQSEHELYDGFTLVRNERVTAPFSFFNWVVLNPTPHASDELEQILRHERVHVRERHSLDMLGAEVVCIVFWFNPAAYLFRHLLHQTLEFSADQTVLAEGVDARTYQYNLVKVSLSAGQSTITNHFSKSQIKSRISMLNRPASSKTTWLKYPVFFAVTLTIASAFARPQHVTALDKYIPKPIAETVEEILKAPVKTKSLLLKHPEDEPLPDGTIQKETNNALVVEGSLINNTSRKLEPSYQSLYTEVRDSTLFWVITPLSTFDDIAQLKAEAAKFGYRFDIDELKFDMLHKFLVRMDATMTSEHAKGQRTTDDVEPNKPMKSFGGQISLVKPGLLGLNELSTSGTYPTKKLMARAATDERIAQNILAENRVNYIVAEGLALTKANWVSKTYDASDLQTHQLLVQDETGLSISNSGQLQISRNETPVYWLNNHAATTNELESLNSTSIHSIITRDKFFNDERVPQRIVLIYTKN